MVLPDSGRDASGAPPVREVRLAIVGFAAVLVCALLGFVTFDVWRAYRDTVVDAQRTGENLARTLEEHAAGTFGRADLILSSIAEAARRSGAGPDAPSVRALVSTYAKLLNPQETLVLVDEAGDVRFDPRDPGSRLNLADRDYFVAHRDRPNDALYVSPSLVSLIGPGRLVGLSRRLSTPEGSFAGIVLYGIGPAYFRELYSSLAIGSSSNVTLWDGRASHVLARYPPDERVMGRGFEVGDLYEQVGQGRRVGMFQSVSPLDGVERMVSYRKVADAPFV